MSEAPPLRPIGPKVPSHSAPWPEKVTLTGKFITLNPLSNSHTHDLFKRVSGEENAYLFDYLYDGPFYDLETFSAYIDAKVNNKEAIFYAIVDAKTNEALGHLSLMRIKPQNRCIEIGNVLFSPQMQKTPGGTECMYLIARYVFDDLGYRRFEWKANDLNAPSRRAAERLGFTFESIFRQHLIVKGRNRDTAWFSMLDKEWPLIKQGFERWLADDNFDESGKQRSRLEDLRNVPGGKDQ